LLNQRGDFGDKPRLVYTRPETYDYVGDLEIRYGDFIRGDSPEDAPRYHGDLLGDFIPYHGDSWVQPIREKSWMKCLAETIVGWTLFYQVYLIVGDFEWELVWSFLK
jgi:hypothetical protein